MFQRSRRSGIGGPPLVPTRANGGAANVAVVPGSRHRATRRTARRPAAHFVGARRRAAPSSDGWWFDVPLEARPNPPDRRREPRAACSRSAGGDRGRCCLGCRCSERRGGLVPRLPVPADWADRPVSAAHRRRRRPGPDRPAAGPTGSCGPAFPLGLGRWARGPLESASRRRRRTSSARSQVGQCLAALTLVRATPIRCAAAAAPGPVRVSRAGHAESGSHPGPPTAVTGSDAEYLDVDRLIGDPACEVCLVARGGTPKGKPGRPRRPASGGGPPEGGPGNCGRSDHGGGAPKSGPEHRG